TATMRSAGPAGHLSHNRAWSSLTEALKGTIGQGTATLFLSRAGIYFDRDASGEYLSNQNEAFYAINCADGRTHADPERMAAEAEEILEVAPTMGEFFGYGGVICARWPVPADETEVDYSAPGAPPILVVGTTEDPATPYRWSVALAAADDSGAPLRHAGRGPT